MNDFTTLADRHEHAYTAFQRIDALEHPAPDAPRWWHGLPWLMLPFGAVAFAGITLSSLRTAPVFKAAAEPVVGKELAIVEAVLAVIITELFLVIARYVHILIRARDGHAPHRIDNHILTGFWLSFGVALFANLYANVGSLALIAPIKPLIDLLVGILVAISAPVLAFICGDVLAVLWLQSERFRAQMREQFRLAMEEYKAARERRWNAQKTRYGVRIEVERENRPTLNDLNLIKNNQISSRSKPSPKLKKAMAWLEANPQHLDTAPRELESEIGVSYGTIFTAQKALKANQDAYRLNGHSKENLQ